jgi:hypothetical protein
MLNCQAPPQIRQTHGAGRKSRKKGQPCSSPASTIQHGAWQDGASTGVSSQVSRCQLSGSLCQNAAFSGHRSTSWNHSKRESFLEAQSPPKGRLGEQCATSVSVWSERTLWLSTPKVNGHWRQDCPSSATSTAPAEE